MLANGRMFVVLAQGTTLALNPSTGEKLWTFTPPMPFSGKRGIGIGDGMLFAGLRDSNVIAVSQETGKLVWTSHHGPEIPSQGMATAPAYAMESLWLSFRSAITSCVGAPSRSTPKRATCCGPGTRCPAPAKKATRLAA